MNIHVPTTHIALLIHSAVHPALESDSPLADNIFTQSAKPFYVECDLKCISAKKETRVLFGMKTHKISTPDTF